MRAVDDPSVRPSRRLSLVQRAQRLRKHVKTVANNKIRRLPEINYINAPVVLTCMCVLYSYICRFVYTIYHVVEIFDGDNVWQN